MWLQRLFSFLLHTHIFIGLCAMSLVWGSLSYLGHNPKTPLMLFALCGTLWVYNLHRTVGAFLMEPNDWPARFRHFYRWRIINFLLSVVTLILSCYLLWFHLWGIRIYLIFPVIVSMAYVAPLGKGKLIRNVPFLKIFLISLTWTWVSILLPYALAGDDQFSSTMILLSMIERFLFIFAITIPFDIRDVEQDTRESLDTLVKVFGPSRARYLALLIILVGIIIGSLTWHFELWSLNFWIVHLILSAYAAIWIYYSGRDKSDTFYSWGLDGSMMILGLSEGLITLL